MAALTKDKNIRTRASAAIRRGVAEAAANAVIFAGALIAKNAAGHVVPASDTAALVVIGVAEENVNNTGGAAAAKTVKYMTDVELEVENAGGAIVQASKYGPAYVADDQSVTTAAVAANDIVAGQVREFTATKVWLYVSETFAMRNVA
jgi:hypothetical protein